MAVPRGHTQLCRHGAADGRNRRGPDRCSLRGRAWVSADWDGPDVPAHECVPCIALVAVDAWPTMRFHRSGSVRVRRLELHGSMSPQGREPPSVARYPVAAFLNGTPESGRAASGGGPDLQAARL